jgi:hypothetical protein
MENQSTKPKFVSSIPNNTLEPVFLGAQNGSQASGGNGKYVPSFLRNKDQGFHDEATKKLDVKQVPEDNLTNFPSLGGTIVTKPKSTLNFSEAIKKPVVEAEKLKVAPAPKMITHRKQVIREISSSGSEDDEQYPDDDGYYRS